MQYKIWIVLLVMFTTPLHSKEVERLTVTSCAYQAGTAREIQTIRQTEGDEWPQFKLQVMKIYGDSQGRTDLLAIAKRVYQRAITTAPQAVHDDVFAACLQRDQGTEPSA